MIECGVNREHLAIEVGRTRLISSFARLIGRTPLFADIGLERREFLEQLRVETINRSFEARGWLLRMGDPGQQPREQACQNP